jgi:hypothetical protein
MFNSKVTRTSANIDGKGLSVGHGWVTLLHPLTPGTHTIVITGDATITTTIVVKPGP